MDVIELKFLLRLLEFDGYRAPISAVKPNARTTLAESDRICRNLRDRGFVLCSYEVRQFTIAPPGQFILQQDSEEMPLAEEEFKVLQASIEGMITPAQTGIPVEKRQIVIQSLAERGLIQSEEEERTIREVWLSERGKQYLQYEYNPSENYTVITLDLLSNYIQFLRLSFQEGLPPVSVSQPLRDERVLLTIQELDRQLATENNLPIFHLREKLEPMLSRDELDEVLYRLERSGKVKLSALQASQAYTPEQIEAGITRKEGSPLFFVSLR
jgi:hypothetical protein